MSSLADRPIGKLADMILNVLWQDRLAVWSALKSRLQTDGHKAIKTAFEEAKRRLLDGQMKDHLDVRWGMNLCMHCNDNNIEKNGIAYVAPNGDGLEFNQCLNCRIGILYNVHASRALLDIYTIGVGEKDEFNGMSFYWDAIYPKELEDMAPLYEIIRAGQWIGTLSLKEQGSPQFLPFEKMKHGIARDDRSVWTADLPPAVHTAVEEFINRARDQIEVASALAHS